MGVNCNNTVLCKKKLLWVDARAVPVPTCVLNTDLMDACPQLFEQANNDATFM